MGSFFAVALTAVPPAGYRLALAVAVCRCAVSGFGWFGIGCLALPGLLIHKRTRTMALVVAGAASVFLKYSREGSEETKRLVDER